MATDFTRWTSPSGVRWWLPSDGSRPVLVVSGGDGEGDGGGEGGGSEGGTGGDGGGGEGGSGGEPRTFSQEQVNTLAAREKREGRSAATKEILTKLGFEKIEDAEEALKAWRQDQDAKKDEATKAQEKADAAKAEAEAAAKEAARDRRIAKAERKLVAAGVRSEDDDESDKLLARAIKNLDLSFDEDVADEDLTAAIAELKKELPSLFEGGTTSNGNGGGETKPKLPSGKNPGAKIPADSKAKATAQLDRMFPNRASAKKD